MNDPQRVAVVGATGYAGFELARLLLRHPGISKPTFYLRESAKPVNCLTEIFPQLRGWGEAPCRPFSVEAIAASGASVAFLATPHEASLELVPAAAGRGSARGGLERRVPLPQSGDVRAAGTSCRRPMRRCWPRRSTVCRSFTAMHCASARLVANPGCYPTSVILGLRPLIEAGWIARERGIVCDCKSGASGAGKEPKRELHFVEVDENFRAYGALHAPAHAGSDRASGPGAGEVMFSTHLLPLARGILSTLYVWLDERREAAEIEALYRQFYAGQAHGAAVAGGPVAGIAARGAHEFLRHRVRAGCQGRAAGGSELPGQPGEGRGGPGRTKHERHDGFPGGGGSAMRMVVKIAGALLDDPDAVRSLARQIAQLAQQGHELLVVHGGGKIFTATLKRMGIESRFVNGLRVTDRETRDVAVMVMGGLLNKRVAGAISAAGQPAVGLCASDASCFLAEPMMHEEVIGALGFVGYLTGVNLEFLETLWRAGIVPVASCLGLGADGETLQHQCGPHGGGLRGIHSRRPADLYDRRGRRAGRHEGAEGGLLRRGRGPDPPAQSFRRHGSEAGGLQAGAFGRREPSAHRRRRKRNAVCFPRPMARKGRARA